MDAWFRSSSSPGGPPGGPTWGQSISSPMSQNGWGVSGGGGFSGSIGNGLGSGLGSGMGANDMGSGMGISSGKERGKASKKTVSSMGSSMGSGMGSGIGSSMGSSQYGLGSGMDSSLGFGSAMGSSGFGSGFGSSGFGLGSGSGSGMGFGMGFGSAQQTPSKKTVMAPVTKSTSRRKGGMIEVPEGTEYHTSPDPNFGVHLARGIEMLEHQIEGINTVYNLYKHHNKRCAGCLFDVDMGLGKSGMTILAGEICTSRRGPKLFVVPGEDLRTQFANEPFKFRGQSLRIMILDRKYMQPADWSGLTYEYLESCDYIFTSYSTIAAIAKAAPENPYKHLYVNKHLFLRPELPEDWESQVRTMRGAHIIFYIKWAFAAFDEIEMLRNPDTHNWRSVASLVTEFAIGLSGTPMTNKETDMYGIMRLLNAPLTTSEFWSEKLYRSMGLDKHRFQKKKWEVDLKLPGVEREPMQLDMSPQEKALYRLLCEMREAKGVPGCHLPLTLLMRLACISPALVLMNATEDGGGGDSENTPVRNSRKKKTSVDQYGREYISQQDEEKQRKSDEKKAYDDARHQDPVRAWVTDPDLLRRWDEMRPWLMDRMGTAGIGCTKMVALRDGILNRVPRGERSIVFSMFNSTYTLVEATLLQVLAPEEIIRYDRSTMNADERAYAFKRFKLDPRVRVFLITFGCGARGHNMTTGSWIWCTDRWWAPNADMQAEARADRIGQKLLVHVIHLHFPKTIEDDMAEKSQSKNLLSDRWLNRDVASDSAHAKIIRTAQECSIDNSGIVLKPIEDEQSIEIEGQPSQSKDKPSLDRPSLESKKEMIPGSLFSQYRNPSSSNPSFNLLPVTNNRGYETKVTHQEASELDSLSVSMGALGGSMLGISSVSSKPWGQSNSSSSSSSSLNTPTISASLPWGQSVSTPSSSPSLPWGQSGSQNSSQNSIQNSSQNSNPSLNFNHNPSPNFNQNLNPNFNQDSKQNSNPIQQEPSQQVQKPLVWGQSSYMQPSTQQSSSSSFGQPSMQQQSSFGQPQQSLPMQPSMQQQSSFGQPQQSLPLQPSMRQQSSFGQSSSSIQPQQSSFGQPFMQQSSSIQQQSSFVQPSMQQSSSMQPYTNQSFLQPQSVIHYPSSSFPQLTMISTPQLSAIGSNSLVQQPWQYTPDPYLRPFL